MLEQLLAVIPSIIEEGVKEITDSRGTIYRNDSKKVHIII